MSKLAFICILTSIVLTNVTHARVQPEEGLWDDPNNQGRGVTIELQNGILIATYFGYDQNGNSQWWQGVGFEGPEGTWSGDFNAFRDGQCNGCNFQFPTVDDNQAIGDFSLTFNSSSSATLNWDGGINSIEKNYYGFGNPLSYLIGLWTLNGYSVDGFNDYGISINNAALRYDGYIEIEGKTYVYGNYTGFEGGTYYTLAGYYGEVNDFALNRVLSTGSLISIIYETDLTDTNFARYDLIINENKAEGVMTVFNANNPPHGVNAGNYNGFLRATGAKLIDQYEKEALFEIPDKNNDLNIEKLKKLAQQLNLNKGTNIKLDNFE